MLSKNSSKARSPIVQKYLQQIRTIEGHLGDVNAIAISSRGDMFASAMDDKTVKVWDLNTGHEIRTIGTHSADVNAIAFSHDGNKIALRQR